MAIQNNKENPIILALIIILGFVAGYYYNSNYNAETITLPTSPIGEKSDLLQFSDLLIAPTQLTSSKFKDNRIFGPLPVDGGSSGVSNPFAH